MFGYFPVITCPLLEIPNEVTYIIADGLEIGSTAEVQCLEGYKLTTNSRNETFENVTCLESGEWSGKLGTCSEISM